MKLVNPEKTRIQIAERGMSLRSFSKQIGVSQPYLSQILKGDRYPSPNVAVKIAKGLEMDVKDIFFINFDNKRYKNGREVSRL
ncbi:helix-turn-helix domain-containing protein [Virgibacillus kimchii]